MGKTTLSQMHDKESSDQHTNCADTFANYAGLNSTAATKRVTPADVLKMCSDLQIKKSNDYQNPHSIIRQADYYPRGVSSILDIIHAKTLRMRSVIEAIESDDTYTENFESIEDSAMDLINYASFLVSYMNGGIDGQEADRDFLNRKVSRK